MTTTQSEDPNERVDHPRHYNAHPSGIECIDLIEHLPTNLGNAVKYVWRCGLKTSETPLRDLKSARWYVERESNRVDLYELWGTDRLKPKTDVVWRALARQVNEKDNCGLLSQFLMTLLDENFDEMLDVLDHAISGLEEVK